MSIHPRIHLKFQEPSGLLVGMMKSKKVILVIVEGMSDKTVLSGLLPKMFGDYVFRFKIIHGDLLTQSSVTRNQILLHVNKQLSYAMSEYKYRADDIKEVVQLVDLDAVYIDPTGIEERENISRVYYAKDRMYVKDYTQILRRNTQKTLNLGRLMESSYLKRGNTRIPYSILYMSINLDHVISNDANVSSNYDKARLSYAFVESFRHHEADFAQFAKERLLEGASDYWSSWQVVQRSDHALKRSTNIYHYLRSVNEEH